MKEPYQTNHQDQLINLLFDDGLQNALPGIAEILMNAAMILERETHIVAREWFTQRQHPDPAPLLGRYRHGHHLTGTG